MNHNDNECRNSCWCFSIIYLIAAIIVSSFYISYSIKVSKNNSYILSHYKKYDNFSITTFTQENKICDVCVLSSSRVCYQYDKAKCDNFNIMYNNYNDNKNDIFECHVFYNNVRDPESVLRNIINEMQYNYTKSFYINKERTECRENLNGLLITYYDVLSVEIFVILLVIFMVLSIATCLCGMCCRARDR